MKQYRFRIWVEGLGQFLYFGLGDKSGGNDEDVEQYTTIEDKKHKRVWEGDIVQLAPFTGAPKRYAVVERYTWGWQLNELTAAYAHQIHYIAADQLKVVGNIHENPELIK